MDKKDQKVFIQNLSLLAATRGETLNDVRVQIYFEDLSDFTLEQVLQAMTWARKNLNKFPSIPELRTAIEGDPEAHADRAWKALGELIDKGRKVSVVIPDPVMAYAIQSVFSTWAGVCIDFSDVSSAYDHNNLERSFKRAYLEGWKKRDRLPANVRFKGDEEQMLDVTDERREFVEEVVTYTLVDGKCRLLERRVLKEPQKGVPCPPELIERWERLYGPLGKPERPDLRSPVRHEVTRDTHDLAVPGGEDRPAGDLGDGYHPAHILDDVLAGLGLTPATGPLRVVPDAGDAAVRDGNPDADVSPDQPGDHHCAFREGEDRCDCGRRYGQ